MQTDRFAKDLYENRISPPDAFCAALADTCQNLPARRRAPRAWLIAAAMVLVMGTLVACIPEARAEVLRLFGFVTPEEHFTGKGSIPTEMTVTQAPSAPAVDSRRDGSDLAAWLSARTDIAVTETIYDGTALYVSLTMRGESALWLLEQYLAGNATRTAIPPERLQGFFLPDVPTEYASGEMTYYSWTDGMLELTFEDGSTAKGLVELLDADAVLASNMDAAAYAAQHDVRAMATLYPRHADLSAGGILQARASLILSTELDPPDKNPPTELLRLDLGTVGFSADGYRTVSQNATGETAVTLYGEVICGTVDASNYDVNDENSVCIYENRVVAVDGVGIGNVRLTAAPTGVFSAELDVSFPADWTREQVERFGNCLRFRIAADDDLGEMGMGVRRRDFKLIVGEDHHNCTYRIGTISFTQHDPNAIETLTFLPEISYFSGYEAVERGKGGEVKTVVGEHGETVTPFGKNERIEYHPNGSIAIYGDTQIFKDLPLTVVMPKK